MYSGFRNEKEWLLPKNTEKGGIEKIVIHVTNVCKKNCRSLMRQAALSYYIPKLSYALYLADNFIPFIQEFRRHKAHADTVRSAR